MSQPQKRKFQGHFGDQKWRDKKQKGNDGSSYDRGNSWEDNRDREHRGDRRGKDGGSRLLDRLKDVKKGGNNNRNNNDDGEEEQQFKPKQRTIINEDGEEVPIVKKTYEEVLKELPEDDKKQRKIATQVLKNAAREKDPKHYNRLILDMGNTRGLYGYAKQAYKDLLANNLKPNEYTYANLINAAARASEPEDMEQFIKDMESRNIPYDLVIYTAIMKLYTTMGDTNKAIEILRKMVDEEKIKPNIRTYHTVLRECTQQNQIEQSELVYKHLLKQYDVTMEDPALKPSPTIYQSMATLYAMNFMLDKAAEYYKLLWEGYNTTNPDSTDERGDLVLLPFALVHAGIAIAQAAICVNDITTARKYIQQCRDVMDKIMSNASIQWWKFKKIGGKSSADNHKKWGKDDKKWHERGGDGDAAAADGDDIDDRVAFEHDSSFTQEQFLKQRAHEFHNDLHKLQAFINKSAHNQHTTPVGLTKSEQITDFRWKPTKTGLADGFSWAQRVIRIDKFIEYNKDKVANAKALRTFKADLCSPTDETFDWQKIFDNDNKEIVVEVGSGTGEWIVNKCLQFPNTNFIAIEVSPSRIYQIYTRMVLEGVKNLVIAQGDGFVFLDDLAPPKSVHQIYVNFPQPPWFSNWRYRLLNNKFFTLCHKALVKSKLVIDSKGQDYTDDRYGMNGQGTVTIVTDDSSYVYLLLRELFHENGRSKELFVSFLSDEEGKSVQFSTDLPPLFGSSYYHRFWQKGEKFRRFYMKLGKNNNLSSSEVQKRYEENLLKQNNNNNEQQDEAPKRQQDEAPKRQTVKKIKK